MPGKDPHRPEGKVGGADHERRASEKQRGMTIRDQDEREAGSPSRFPAEEQVGGSRPGVEGEGRDRRA